MADVMFPSLPKIQRRFAHRDERAQLLLITALALAVILVTVALLLNAAIFTENVATRDTTADGHEAIELRGEVVDGIGEQIERENRQDQTHTELVENITSGIDETGLMVDHERARSGVVARLSHDPNDIENGLLLRWDTPDEPRQFDGLGTNGTLVETIEDTRAFTLTVDPNRLYAESEPNASQIEENAFGVRFLTNGDNVTQYIYDDTDGNLIVAQSIEGADPQRQCRIEHTALDTTVDLTGDRLSTTNTAVDCYRGLWPDDSPETIEFVNGEAAEGTFAVTVDENAVTNANGVADWDAIYSVTVDIGYRSQDLTFETTARIAPGEPR